MTSTGYHDTGEEWAQKLAYRQDLITRNASVDVLLYDDSTDDLADADDVGDVGTEPTDGNYARQSVDLDSSDVTLEQSDGDVEAAFAVTFDLTDTTGSVDARAVVANFQSDVVNSESSENDHLLDSGGFGGSVDLDTLESLDVEITLSLN